MPSLPRWRWSHALLASPGPIQPRGAALALRTAPAQSFGGLPGSKVLYRSQSQGRVMVRALVGEPYGGAGWRCLVSSPPVLVQPCCQQHTPPTSKRRQATPRIDAPLTPFAPLRSLLRSHLTPIGAVRLSTHLSITFFDPVAACACFRERCKLLKACVLWKELFSAHGNTFVDTQRAAITRRSSVSGAPQKHPKARELGSSLK